MIRKKYVKEERGWYSLEVKGVCGVKIWKWIRKVCWQGLGLRSQWGMEGETLQEPFPSLFNVVDSKECW